MQNTPINLLSRIAHWLHPQYAITHLAILSLVTALAFAAMFLPLTNEASTTTALDPANITSETPPLRTTRDITLDLVAPEESASDDTIPTPDTVGSTSLENWRVITIKNGDTLSAIFHRVGLNSKDVHSLVYGTNGNRELARVHSGQQLAFLFGDNKQLQKIKYIKNKLESIEFVKTEKGYSAEAIQLTPDITFNFAQITIDSSLFASANKAGIPDSLTVELASVFGWDIDFMLDLHKGDTFNFVYEEKFLNGEKIGNGDIVAAEFNKRGYSYQAVRYTDKDGTSRYFTPSGMSMKKEFLRTPVDFAQISSQFNLKRMHPILHKIRAHKGTDYAAPLGTPVRATGNGRVTYAALKGGYGNTIIIQHGQVYETVYGHLSKYARGIKAGTKVTQGQIIGYVGMTGLATGPHLHYEFHINGQVRNPVTVKFPNSSPISISEKPRFLAQTQQYITQLASYTHKLTPTQIALAE